MRLVFRSVPHNIRSGPVVLVVSRKRVRLACCVACLFGLIIRLVNIHIYSSGLLTDSKYPQERVADTHNPLREYDFNEDELLNDLDQTSEVDKLRQQNFKLFRVTSLSKRLCRPLIIY